MKVFPQQKVHLALKVTFHCPEWSSNSLAQLRKSPASSLAPLLSLSSPPPLPTSQPKFGLTSAPLLSLSKTSFPLSQAVSLSAYISIFSTHHSGQKQTLPLKEIFSDTQTEASCPPVAALNILFFPITALTWCTPQQTLSIMRTHGLFPSYLPF